MKIKLLSVLLIAAFLGACSSQTKQKTEGHVDTGQSTGISNGVVYFDFDKAIVKEEGRAVVEHHAKYLTAHPEVKVRLEGHADERGSREYNVGLGQRRAQAVRRMMVFLGVNDRQMELISYGEEKPVALGHDEASWAQNRRVEINYH